jgi:hypothetical protein
MPSRAGVLTLGGPSSSRTLALRGPATGTLDVATLTLTPGAPGVPGDVAVRSPDGATRVLGLAETCTGVAVLTCATGTPCAETPVTETSTALPTGVTKVVLPVIPSLPFSRRCAQTPASVQGLGARIGRALAWGRDGLIVAFRGALYRVANDGAVAHVRLGESLNGGFTPGAAVSENGATVVLPGLSGLWVRERNAWRRWSPQALTGRFAQMSDLTVTSDARVIAGLVGTQVWLLERTNVR